MTAGKPLAVVGNVNVDLVMGPLAPWPNPGTEIEVEACEIRCGGAAGNAALAWHGLGRSYQIAANTGDDVLGAWLREAFAPHSDSWPVAAAGTTASVGLTHPDTERTFITSRGHTQYLSWPQVRNILNWRDLSGGCLLLCGSFVTDRLADDYDMLFSEARSHKVRVALDTGWPVAGWTPDIRQRALGWLGCCDLLLLNEEETMALSGAACLSDAWGPLLALMPESAIVVVKRGAGGATAKQKGRGVQSVPARQVTVLDTVGAGDVFNAAFLVARADGQSLGASLERAVATAATAISTRPRRYAGNPPDTTPSGDP